MTSASLRTRKMSDRHEDDLVDLLGGVKTRNSGAVWSDQSDGHQTGLDQFWRFAWDGKSTLGKSVSVTRDMLEKLREQCRGLEPMLPLRWYANDRLTEVDEDWIAVEAETFAQILDDANQWRRVKESGCLIGVHSYGDPDDRSSCQTCGASSYEVAAVNNPDESDET